MTDFAAWIFGLVKALFLAFWDFLQDLFIAILDLLLTALLVVFKALPLPDFLHTGGLQTLFSAIPGDVWFFASHFRLGECMAMFGAAITFRLARKAATLFQW